MPDERKAATAANETAKGRPKDKPKAASKTPSPRPASVMEAAECGCHFVAGALSEHLLRLKELFGGSEELTPLLEFLEDLTHSIILMQMVTAEHSFIHSLLCHHPDALSLRKDEGFIEWAMGQPPVVQACLVHSVNPEDAVWAISLYKEEMQGKGRDEAARKALAGREERLRATAAPQGGGVPVPSSSRFTREDIAKMSVADFKKNESSINAALASGQIG